MSHRIFVFVELCLFIFAVVFAVYFKSIFVPPEQMLNESDDKPSEKYEYAGWPEFEERYRFKTGINLKMHQSMYIPVGDWFITAKELGDEKKLQEHIWDMFLNVIADIEMMSEKGTLSKPVEFDLVLDFGVDGVCSNDNCHTFYLGFTVEFNPKFIGGFAKANIYFINRDIDEKEITWNSLSVLISIAVYGKIDEYYKTKFQSELELMQNYDIYPLLKLLSVAEMAELESRYPQFKHWEMNDGHEILYIPIGKWFTVANKFQEWNGKKISILQIGKDAVLPYMKKKIEESSLKQLKFDLLLDFEMSEECRDDGPCKHSYSKYELNAFENSNMMEGKSIKLRIFFINNSLYPSHTLWRQVIEMIKELDQFSQSEKIFQADTLANHVKFDKSDIPVNF